MGFELITPTVALTVSDHFLIVSSSRDRQPPPIIHDPHSRDSPISSRTRLTSTSGISQ
jgi:hypothetical protein